MRDPPPRWICHAPTEWAERNLRLNGLTGRAHRLMQADVLGWLRESTEQFDLIFIDPPTFSNSKRMEDAFDVQRDHIRLMTDSKRLLRKGGTIMFSNNKRGFRMDHDGLAALGLKAQEISQKRCRRILPATVRSTTAG